MQIPEEAPTLGTLMREIRQERILSLLARMGDLNPGAGGRYLHWDDLRRRTPPEGLSVREWWFLIAFARSSQRSQLPLRDASGAHFTVTRSDVLSRLLHQVDRELGHSRDASDPRLLNADQRNRYVVRSLMEEAISSSQLEGAATTRRVAKELMKSGRAPRTHDERMILNNYRAMAFIRKHRADPLSMELLFELHAILTDGTLAPADVGRLRTGDEAITIQDFGTGRVLHVPPGADTLTARMGELLHFSNATDDAEAFVHPVVRAISLHFMIGWLHPFVDGNGRTARALFYWSMLRQGYWLTEFISLSTAIKRAHGQYNRSFLLTETDGGDLTYFILHQLELLKAAIGDLNRYLSRKAQEVLTAERLMKGAGFLNGRQRAFLSRALRHPGTKETVRAYQVTNGVVYETARTDLLSLAEAGLLDKRKIGKAFHFEVPADLEERLARMERGLGRDN